MFFFYTTMAEGWVLRAGYYKLNQLQVTNYSYYKWYAKNKNQTFTDGFIVYDCAL